MTVIRESVSEFVASDCWGYPKFMHIEDLYKEGYLSAEDEKLVIRFYIRAPLYSQHSKDQKRYIQQLEEKTKLMQENIAKYEKACQEKGMKVDGIVPIETKKKSPESAKQSTPPNPEQKSPVEMPKPILPVQSIKEESKMINIKPEEAEKGENLEDMIKNITIEAKWESDENEESENEPEKSENDTEEVKELNPISEAQVIKTQSPQNVLKEISNRNLVNGSNKFGKKVLLHIKKKNDNEEEKIVVLKKGSVSERGTPENKEKPDIHVNSSSLLNDMLKLDEPETKPEINKNDKNNDEVYYDGDNIDN